MNKCETSEVILASKNLKITSLKLDGRKHFLPNLTQTSLLTLLVAAGVFLEKMMRAG